MLRNVNVTQSPLTACNLVPHPHACTEAEANFLEAAAAAAATVAAAAAAADPYAGITFANARAQERAWIDLRRERGVVRHVRALISRPESGLTKDRVYDLWPGARKDAADNVCIKDDNGCPHWLSRKVIGAPCEWAPVTLAPGVAGPT
jgi:hypothetical protein